VPESPARLEEVSAFLNGEHLEVDTEVLDDDPMKTYNPDAYFTAGPQALRAINMALLATGRTGARNILDFASGGGRIMRYLRVAFPDAQLTACDIYTQGIDFCAEKFGAKPIQATIDINKIPLEGPYDLIFVGSLFTHVGEKDWDKMLTRFEEVLIQNGVLVFTVYGRTVAYLMRERGHKLDVQEEHIPQFLRAYDERGFAFAADYAPEHDHGDAMAKRAWVAAKLEQYPSLRLLLYTENAWLGQDVIAVAKAEVRPGVHENGAAQGESAPARDFRPQTAGR
jgi:SAM-dependent methyltransferase